MTRHTLLVDKKYLSHQNALVMLLMWAHWLEPAIEIRRYNENFCDCQFTFDIHMYSVEFQIYVTSSVSRIIVLSTSYYGFL